MMVRLWAALLLAVIGLQAAEPIRAPLERVTGSAFSAATADVALASNRRTEATVLKVVPTPPLPEMPQVVEPMPARTLVPAARLRPSARAPPQRQDNARLPDPRGPPLP